MKYSVVCIPCSTSIQRAIQLIERSPFESAFVLDDRGAYMGGVSTTDLRRFLISGAPSSAPLNDYPLKHVHKISQEALLVKKLVDGTIANMELLGARFLPVVRADGNIAEILAIEDLDRLHGSSRVDSRPIDSARRILVVGGAGYLGSVLTRKLLERGFRVRILDSFIYGRRSVESLDGNDGLEIIEGDFRNIHACVSSLTDTDAVVLLAAIVGDPASKARPVETIETNVLAAQALATACKLHHINRFLYASTCSVYGIGEALLDENAPLNPVSLYARTKIESEKIILAMGDEYFSPTILRMGTLYGYSPRMRFDLVVNTMSMKSFVERKIQVFGGGQWRPLLGVEDAADVYVSCLEAGLQDVGNQVFNVGFDSQNYQISEVAEIIRSALGGIPIFTDDSNLDARDYRVSFTKLKQMLGVEPRQTIEGACRTIFEKLETAEIRNPAQKIYYNHYFDSAEE